MTPADARIARATPLLAGVDQEALDRLLAASSIRRCREREVIARERRAAECLHVLLGGMPA